MTSRVFFQKGFSSITRLRAMRTVEWEVMNENVRNCDDFTRQQQSGSTALYQILTILLYNRLTAPGTGIYFEVWSEEYLRPESRSLLPTARAWCSLAGRRNSQVCWYTSAVLPWLRRTWEKQRNPDAWPLGSANFSATSSMVETVCKQDKQTD